MLALVMLVVPVMLGEMAETMVSVLVVRVMPGVPVTVPTLLAVMLGGPVKSPRQPLSPPMRGKSTAAELMSKWFIRHQP